MRRYIRSIVAIGVLTGAGAGCLDLDVVNENLPDTERALREPAEVEQVIRSSFTIWRSPLNNGDFGRYVSIAGSEIASTVVFRQIQPSFEPRQVLNNDPVADEVWIPRNPWDQYNSSLANAIDGLHRILDDGLVIETPDASGVVADNTDRARIFGKLMEDGHSRIPVRRRRRRRRSPLNPVRRWRRVRAPPPRRPTPMYVAYADSLTRQLQRELTIGVRRSDR